MEQAAICYVCPTVYVAGICLTGRSYGLYSDVHSWILDYLCPGESDRLTQMTKKHLREDAVDDVKETIIMYHHRGTYVWWS